jgi:hypothetical protein
MFRVMGVVAAASARRNLSRQHGLVRPMRDGQIAAVDQTTDSGSQRQVRAMWWCEFTVAFLTWARHAFFTFEVFGDDEKARIPR